ncbi:MAG: FG-GAP repeat protein [Candidatus Delongbacteria bacterium]|nr:FG-GAP repeat protein [Candidatus Delongbacteria bacterium]MBN2833736.1 FG-GAP repeat protein [Candidatus Delongbacteria bacterium]
MKMSGLKSLKVLVFLLCFQSLFAQYSEIQFEKITPTDPAAGKMFGNRELCVSGDYAVISALGDNEGKGSAYIFKKSGENWTQFKKIVPEGQTQSENFGFASTLNGEHAIVCAPGRDFEGKTDCGIAIFYRKDQGGVDNWGEVCSFYGEENAESFGRSAAIYGNWAVVGDAYDDHSGYNDAGSVYLYNFNGSTWNFVKKIYADTPSPNVQFGDRVAISDNYLVVSAPYSIYNGNQYNCGSVYIYKRDLGGANNWGFLKSYVNTTASDFYGTSVALNEDFLVVGSYGHDYDSNNSNIMTNSGAAFIYSKNEGGLDNWGLVKKVVASDRKGGDNFGEYVSIEGNDLVVGAPGQDFDNSNAIEINNAGAVYSFSRNEGGENQWGEKYKITSPERSVNAQFGKSVSLSNGLMLVAAPYAYTNTGEGYFVKNFINAIPTSLDNNAPFNEDNIYTFSNEVGSESFSFADENVDDELDKVKITSLPLVGTLFLDSSNFGIIDEGEEISLNVEISPANISIPYLFWFSDIYGLNKCNF